MRKGLAEAKNIDLTIYSPKELVGHSQLDHPEVYHGQDNREISRAYIFHKGVHYYALVPTFGTHKPRFVGIGERITGRGMSKGVVMGIGAAIVAGLVTLGVGFWTLWGLLSNRRGRRRGWELRRYRELCDDDNERGHRTSSRRIHARDIKWGSHIQTTS
jgi:hypothetical protein